MTIREFRMPDLGEGLTESELVEWHVSPGDTVTLNQNIADVETAKAVVQLPSPVAGVVVDLLAEPGSTVAVGSAIVRFEVDGPVDAAADAPPGDHTVAGEDPTAGEDPAGVDDPADAALPAQRTAVLVGYGPKVETGVRPQRKARTFSTRPSAEQHAGAARSGAGSALALAAPPVRKLAHELGVDLTTLRGSGEGGVIVRADVTRAADESAGRASDQATVAAGETRIPIRGVRKATASAMVASAFTAPHVTEFLTVDVTRSTQLIGRLTASGHRASMLGLISKAVCWALDRTPELNSRWDDEAGEIVQFGSVALGIAVATERGLMVPHIAAAERLSVPAMTEAIAELAAAARAAQLTPEQLTGSTFTISNIGVFGVDAGTPILNPGEAGILAVGAVRRQPWEFEGEVALRDVMTLSLSFDHRLADGEQGARLLTDVGGLLNDPASALAVL
ncbi:MAG: 2-oxo acid dehydrogenase subunit E2 [Microcella sp.]|uniref:dihydrolipoamide acetyltransferase family protein n=1 Tax=Microcella sp. TaxID=1913979 RepID=UPI0024CA3679|nr:dihydrolipoamide acetyltransferase family protein [Microcella sp.]UYN84670.1 MAG: 2-oxo acid dehydrogenase subunit E2 [Microcella sp.]